MLPGETIGILGGGQLGRMIAIEAKKMGYLVICLDPTPDSPCGQVADDQIVARFDDAEAATQLAERSALVLYEFENIDASVVQFLEKRCRLPQKSRILSITQDRLAEKSELKRAGFPVVPHIGLFYESELILAVKKLGYPCILKLTRGGYDGKGQLTIRGSGDLAAALKQIHNSGQNWILEKMIPFTGECSAIVARNAAGETALFPVPENIHRDNILFMSIAPARIDPETEKAVRETALKIAEAFDLVGLLAVEFFVTAEGPVVNELAPRPHNSGHFTFDACYTSQFEQLIRALCGLPFASTELMTPVVMVNILGKDLDKVLRETDRLPPDTKLHIYGKHGERSPKRKMGHLTIKSASPHEIIGWANQFFG